MKILLTLLFLLSFVLLSFTSSYCHDTAKMAIPLIIRDAKSEEGVFNSRVIFLADQLLRNKSKLIESPIIITSFQNLENLEETNHLGRLISEALIHEMLIRNFRVIDFRLTQNVHTKETGEIVLSRDPKKIKETYRTGFVLTGTYTLTKNGYFINARIIDIESSEVISTAQVLMPETLFKEPPKPEKPLPSIKIVGASQ